MILSFTAATTATIVKVLEIVVPLACTAVNCAIKNSNFKKKKEKKS